MRSEVEFSHEDEPVDYRSLHQLYVDINRSTSSPDFNRALVKYLAAEYCISDQDSLSRAVFSMLEHQPTPTRRDYELRPAQARDMARLVVYTTLVPLYEHSRLTSPDLTTDYVKNVMRMATPVSSPHNEQDCHLDVYDYYQDCALGPCPRRYIVDSIAKRVDRVVRLFGVIPEQTDLTGYYIGQVAAHIDAAYNRKLISLEQKDLLHDDLQYNLALASGQYMDDFEY